MKRYVFLALGVTFLGGALAFGQAAKPGSATEDLTVITSDKLTFDYKKHYALFEDNVVVVDPQMKLMSDRMTVTFNESNKVESIRAEGKVLIVQDDKTANSDLAIYNVGTGEIVLTGHPTVTRGKDVLRGEKITFWRDENRMRVEKGATLFLQNTGKGGKGDLMGGGLGGK
jgi:lipopolysaccharide export system protein LptA